MIKERACVPRISKCSKNYVISQIRVFFVNEDITRQKSNDLKDMSLENYLRVEISSKIDHIFSNFAKYLYILKKLNIL